MIRRGIVPVLALLAAAWALWVLEGARAGIEITRSHVGDTPVTHLTDGSDGPPVVVAHGFAGSRQMMQGYALVLAQAGYTVHVFDFEGHGRHTEPMSGDVDSLDGTTRRLVSQTLSVARAVRAPDDARVALLGHSMATDVLVRAAEELADAGPLVLLSAFSQAIDARHPTDMLLITGAGEPGLRDFALEAVRMVDPDAAEGETVRNGDVRRAAIIAPAVEHVAILHSRAGRQAALDWMNSYYDRAVGAAVPPTGWALLGLLAAITTLFAPVARKVPCRPVAPAPVSGRAFWLAATIPVAAVPLLAAPLDSQILPVLVADYLGLHLALFGGIQLAILVTSGHRCPMPRIWLSLALLLWALGLFGLALDRYGANFWPVGSRPGIIALLAIGAVPFMLADAWLAWGASLLRRVVARLGFLVSLGLAVALDFEGLFFLIMIAPVIVLFWLTFGAMGRMAARRGGPMTAGIALGLALAWALGVSFPLFSA